MAMCAALERVPAKSASLPKATHRCHSVRDSQEPASFFQEVLVANEKIAMLVALAAFLSASLPMKPIRLIRLRTYVSPCSARWSRAPESEWARLPRPEAAFLGGPERGSQNPKERRAPQKSPEAMPRRTDRTGERDRTEHPFCWRRHGGLQNQSRDFRARSAHRGTHL